MPKKRQPLPDYSEPLTEDDLAALYMGAVEPPPDDPDPPAPVAWLPALTPKQMNAFLDESENTLAVGNRFTGKGWSCGYNLVKHAYDHYNALVLVIVKTKRQGATGGFFSKLGAEILPDFRNNLDGFQYKGPYQTIEKDVVYSVTNRYGGVSIIQMMSILHDSDLERKIKGIEASKTYVDEITLFESDAVFTHLKGTLKRRNHIPAEVQTLLASCNPDDPDHWVARQWDLVLLADGTLDVEATNAKNPEYRVIEIMKEDNPDPKVEAYYKNLKDALKNKPTQLARDIDGKWVALPKGNAILKDHFVRDFHVKGSKKEGLFLSPVPGYPIMVGWDPGDVNHGVSFLQEVPTKEKILWSVFDEISYISKKVSLETLAHDALKKMQFWCEEMDFAFTFTHIADKSAFDRFRSATGSFDNATIERVSRENLGKYPRLAKPIKMIECPKPDGSVAARTRVLMDLLERGELFVSANCDAHIATFEKITSKKDDPFAPDTRSPYKHIYDSCGYPIFYAKCGGVVVPQALHPGMQPRVFGVGA